MKNSKRVTLPPVLILLVCASLIGGVLAGCGRDKSVSPIDAVSHGTSSDATAVTPERGLDSKDYSPDDARIPIDDNAIFGPASETAQFDVDPELGGTFAAGRVIVSIPRDALQEPITLKISEKNASCMAVIGELLPHGQIFLKPVTLSFDLRGTRAEEWEDACVFWLDEGNNEWVSIGGTHDMDAHVLSVDVEHFSHYGVGRAGWFQKPPPPLTQEPSDDSQETGAP